MKFRFLGASGGHITGSCTHFQYDRRGLQFLVDCGLVQGEGDDDSKNAAPFPFNPSEINFVLLTHAHQDHCGLIPKLYREGFQGRVICTKATARLATLSLLDSAGHPNCPFSEDNVKAIKFDHIDDRDAFGWSRMLPIAEDLFASFSRSAHILGAASITIGWLDSSDERAYLVMSGDLGNNTKANPYQPLLAGRQGVFSYPATIIVESTYGGRVRDQENSSFEGRIEALRKIVQEEVFDKKSLLIVPAFSLQRTQEFIFDLHLVFARHFSTEEASSAPFLPANVFYDDFQDGAWNHQVHTALFRAIKSLPLEEQEKWTRSFVEIGEKGRANFTLTEDAKVSIADLKAFLAQERHVYPVEVVLDSPLARKMSAVFRDELCRRQHKTPSETQYRNRLMGERFDCTDESDLDDLVRKLLPEDSEEVVRVKSGIHEFRYEVGYKTPRPSVLAEKGCILLTGGGMCNGGPVIEHFKKTATAKRRTVVLTNGYMAAGSLGGTIQAVCEAKRDGKELPEESFSIGDLAVTPQEVTLNVTQLQGYYSGHADQTGLLDFVFEVVGPDSSKLNPKPATVFINHGSHTARRDLKSAIEARASNAVAGERPILRVEVPDDLQRWYDLDAKEWVAPSVESRTDALLLNLISEQRKTNQLLQRLLDKSGPSGYGKTAPKKKNP
ncbi:MAG: MBL fold metallo-hydrolase [Burkholderiaceae bacterium]|nr:MBL fold metallo-hydrolase [Burkholderiaceae bacterium]